MFFDNLAGIVERHLPEFTGRMRDARLFRMEPRAPSASASDTVSSWEPDQRTVENFRLPFPVIAIETCADRQGNSDRCTVLSVVDEQTRQLDCLTASRRDDQTTIASSPVYSPEGLIHFLECLFGFGSG